MHALSNEVGNSKVSAALKFFFHALKLVDDDDDDDDDFNCRLSVYLSACLFVKSRTQLFVGFHKIVKIGKHEAERSLLNLERLGLGLGMHTVSVIYALYQNVGTVRATAYSEYRLIQFK